MSNIAARLDLRMNAAEKNRITRAADLRGVPVSVFARNVLLSEADNAITAETVFTLSAVESRRFLAALDKPFKPNARMKKAMDDAAKLIG